MMISRGCFYPRLVRAWMTEAKILSLFWLGKSGSGGRGFEGTPDWDGRRKGGLLETSPHRLSKILSESFNYNKKSKTLCTFVRPYVCQCSYLWFRNKKIFPLEVKNVVTTLYLKSSLCDHICRNCGCSPIWITHSAMSLTHSPPHNQTVSGLQQLQKSSPNLEPRKTIPSSQREVAFLALLASPCQVSYLTFSEVCKKIVSSSTLPDGWEEITLRHILWGWGRRNALPRDGVTSDFHHSACICSCRAISGSAMACKYIWVRDHWVSQATVNFTCQFP